MNSKFSLVKSTALVAALAAGITGMAYADDSSMARFGGDSYAALASIPADKAPSTWRQANPSGVPERQLQALSSEGLGYDFQKFAFDKSASEWRQANPHGLSERELQALSSESFAWHQPSSAPTRSLASTNEATVVAKTAAK
jgi:hypothetical protein